MMIFGSRGHLLWSFRADCGLWAWTKVQRKGRRYVVSKVSSGHERPGNSGRVMATIGSRFTHILHDNFPRLKDELLALQVHDRMRQEALIGGEAGLEICTKVLSSGADGMRVVAVGIPAEDTEPVAMALDDPADLMVFTPACASLAGLVHALGLGPAVVVMVGKDRIELVAVDGAVPWMYQVVPTSGLPGNELEALGQNVDSLGQACQRLHGFTPGGVVVLGSVMEVPETIGGFQVLEPDFSSILDLEDPLDGRLFPDLLGTLFADRSFDLTPTNWRRARMARRAVALTSGAMAAMAAVLTASGLVLHLRNGHYLSQYQETYGRLAARAQAIEEALPEGHEKHLLERWLRIRAKNGEQSRPSRLLAALGAAVPEGVSIDAFRIVRGPSKGDVPSSAPQGSSAVYQVRQSGISGARSGQISSQRDPGRRDNDEPERMLDQGLEIHLALVAQGSLGQAKALVLETLSRLSERFEVIETGWNYLEGSRQARIEVTLSPRRKEAVRVASVQEGRS